jgi:hypothetical protein
MKSKLFWGCLMMVLMIHSAGFSQTVSPAVRSQFNASIVNQVFEFNKFGTVSNEQQILLARLLDKRDNTVAAMLSAGKPASEIDLFSEKMQKEMYALSGVQKYYDSVSAVTVRLAVQTELRYYARYRPSPFCLSKIKAMAANKHHQLAFINRLTVSTARKDSLQNQVCLKEDSLIETALIKDGAFISSSQFMAAIRYQTMLHLTDGQTDSLLADGIYLVKLRDSAWNINPLIPFDAKDYENQHMSRILTDEQYSMLLRMRYRPDATINAEHDWLDLEKRGLTKDLNKETTVKALTNYYIKLKSSSNLYAFDLNKQSAYARSVRDDQPKALKILTYARKNNVTSAANQTLNNQW